jgi:hypothetical protein
MSVDQSRSVGDRHSQSAAAAGGRRGAGEQDGAHRLGGDAARDATERSLPPHWDIDPVRVMRPRFADSISPSGLRGQAEHMTAGDFCAAREVISCQAGAIHT